MPSPYTDVQMLLLRRFSDVRALLDAYRDLQAAMESMIVDTGREVAKWARGHGYEFDADAREPEYTIWRPEWANRRNEPAVYFGVGGFAPHGYRKVKSDHPYAWVYNDLSRIRVKSSVHPQFASDLLVAVRGLDGWQSPDVEDDGLFGLYLTAHDDAQRLRWMHSSVDLAEFVKSAFELLLPLSAHIDEVLAAYRPG